MKQAAATSCWQWRGLCEHCLVVLVPEWSIVALHRMHCLSINTVACVLALQENWLEDLNPESLTVIQGAFASPQLAKAQPGDRCAVRMMKLILWS
jgi:hypothetical protein